MASVEVREGDKVRVVNYAPGEDVGEMAHPNGRTGTVVQVGGIFIELSLDEPLRVGEHMVTDLLVQGYEIEVLNA